MAKLNPSPSQAVLIEEVLEDLGEPEDIAFEFKRAEGMKEKARMTRGRIIRVLARLLFAVAVVFLAAWFVANMTAGSVDFWTAVIVMLVLAVAEWYLRA
jgi:NADH:ubiquinone oxidoreductase subunit 3 (subunit A)